MPDVDRTKRNKREFKKEEEEGGGDNRGITPEQDVTDSILTSRPATSYNLVLTIYVLCPIDAFFFFFFFNLT